MSEHSLIERPLPHSLEAERAVIGAILLASSGTVEVEDAFRCLAATDFFLPQNRVIYRNMQRLREQSKPTNDTVLLSESLGAAQELEAAGGIAYLSQVPDGLPRVSNLAYYVQIIKLKSELRARIYKYQAQTEKLLGANGDAAELLEEDRTAFVSYFTPRLVVETNRILRFKTAAEPPTYERIEWIAKGLVPKGAITSINAKIKLGKTAFVLAMARAVLEGVDFLGEPTTKTTVVYLTEQSASSFDRAIDVAGLRGLEGFSYIHFTETCGMDWSDVAEKVAKHCKDIGAGLFVVDTLSQFASIAGDSENDAGAALAAMLPLQKIAAEGIAVIIVRHARKSGGDVEDAGRGSSAFDGAADLILSLRKPEGNQPDNRRLLSSSGRYSGETHNNLLIQMTESGFTAIGNQEETVIADAKEKILAVAPRSETDAATVKELAEATELTKMTVNRACNELVLAGKLKRAGKGKKGSPFRHWVEEMRFVSTPTLGVEPETHFEECREPGEEVNF